MRRIVISWLVLFFMTFYGDAHAFTASYDQITMGIKGIESRETNVKIKDDKMRMEMNMPHGKLITIIDNTSAYQYMPDENKAYKITTKGPTNIKNLSDYKAYLSALDAKVIGSANVGEYDCDVYEFTDPGTKVKAKAWVWRANNFPVKYELDMAEGTVTTIMKNVKINVKMNDSLFQIPKGVEILEMRRALNKDETQN